MFGTSIAIGHVYQEIFLIEPTSGASIQKKREQPSKSSKKKGKDLPKKAEKERHGARSDVQRKMGSGSPRTHAAERKRKAKAPELTAEAQLAWGALQQRLDDQGELVDLDTMPIESTHAEAQARGSHRSLPKSYEPASSEYALHGLQNQSPPRGSLRVMSHRPVVGDRKSVPVTPRKSPDKSNRVKEAYHQDLEMLRQSGLNLNAIKKMSDASRSADVTELRAARDESRKQYGDITKRVDRARRELKALESEKQVLAGSIAALDDLIRKNPQASFPEDTEWDAIGELPEKASPSRGMTEHRRALTDRI